jgi:hypothetical protein
MPYLEDEFMRVRKNAKRMRRGICEEAPTSPVRIIDKYLCNELTDRAKQQQSAVN